MPQDFDKDIDVEQHDQEYDYFKDSYIGYMDIDLEEEASEVDDYLRYSNGLGQGEKL